ncbi:lysylphosphatidylglycerol synthase transmembrane domain-containing protein [Halapricum desulfuricans]|uniref:Putative flippase n=1 Tax=Halapricum desulfuricans TaxID=2841257 RepID=A0A897NSZ5_9EURY|nr:lysylphosphatidylglycerol synthase transmembrane domain-containing protein [Halapricum desulfuricans]QSG15361.1 putative flippase [Halapricum desulfuricans]
MRVDRRSILVGFAGAGAVLALLLWVIGIDGVVSHLSEARLPVVAVLFGLVPVWLTAWGLCLHTVLRALGTPMSRVRSVVVFVAATFANQVTPFGQAGGEPISALLISEAAGTEYENGLAAIASVDTLHFFPSIGLAVVGFGLFALRGFEFGRSVLVAGAAVAVLVAGVASALALGWRFRDWIESMAISLLTPVARRAGRILPRVSPPSRDGISERVDGFFVSIERVGRNRRLLVLATTFSLAGWFTLAVCLWVALAAIGFVVPFPAMLVVLPVASIAGVFPVPGGLGGVEAAFVVMIVSTTSVATTAATAAVVIYRGATYWLPMLVGGGIAAVLVDGRRRAPSSGQ